MPVQAVSMEPNVGYQQKAPSQTSRTAFTPGKATSKATDQNWPVDFHCYYSGIPHIDAKVNADKLRQTVVNDSDALVTNAPTIPTPANDPDYATNPFNVVIRLNKTTDTPEIKTDYMVTVTETQDNTGQQEIQNGSLTLTP